MTVTQQSIAGALATIFEDMISEQINRSAVTLQTLPTGRGPGKNITWDARFGGDVSGPRADGIDLVAADFKTDPKVPATLNYGTYDAPFAMTGKAIATALNTKNPRELENLFAEELGTAVKRLAKGLNRGIYTGAGGAEELVGLHSPSGPLDVTGTYANISRATHAEWASNVIANGGTPRAVSFALLREASNAIYNASGENCDLIYAPSDIWGRIGDLFGPNRQHNQETTIRGQKIILSGGHKAIEWDGITIIRDVDHPAGKITMLSSEHVKVCQLPDEANAVNGSMGMIDVAGGPEVDFGMMNSGLVARINQLGRAGDNYKFQLILYPQLQVRTPNAQAVIADIDPAL